MINKHLHKATWNICIRAAKLGLIDLTPQVKKNKELATIEVSLKVLLTYIKELTAPTFNITKESNQLFSDIKTILATYKTGSIAKKYR